jgi:hypothetical protein
MVIYPSANSEHHNREQNEDKAPIFLLNELSSPDSESKNYRISNRDIVDNEHSIIAPNTIRLIVSALLPPPLLVLFFFYPY